MKKRSTSSLSIASLLLALYGVFLFLPLLSYSPVFQVSEGREGVVVEEILDSGNIVLPLRNGEFVPSKPILFHWVGAALSSLTGEYREFELRLPSALAAIGTGIVLFLLVAELATLGAGVIAALLLFSMYGFIHLAQDGRVDMLFTFFTTAAIAVWLVSAARAVRNGKTIADLPQTTYLFAAILTGLAVLTKGPLGIVQPILVISAIAYAHGSRLRTILKPVWIVAALIPLPWYAMAASAGSGSFVERQLIFENVSRYFGGEGITVKGPLFYLPHVLGQPAPWSLIFLVYLLFVGREEYRRRREKRLRNRFIPDETFAAFGIRSGLIWFAVLLLFLSFSAGKRRAYLLPLLPAVALVLSLRLSATWERLSRERRQTAFTGLLRYEPSTWGVLIWLIVAILGVCAVWFPHSAFFPVTEGKLRLTLDALPVAMARRNGLVECYYFVFSLGALALWIYGFYKRRPVLVGAAIVTFVELVLVVYMNTWVAVRGVTHTYEGFAKRVSTLVPEDLKIGFVKTRKDESFDGFFFYFRRHVRTVDPLQTPREPGVYLARRSWLGMQEGWFLGRVEELTEGGRKVDKAQDRLVLFRLR